MCSLVCGEEHPPWLLLKKASVGTTTAVCLKFVATFIRSFKDVTFRYSALSTVSRLRASTHRTTARSRPSVPVEAGLHPQPGPFDRRPYHFPIARQRVGGIGFYRRHESTRRRADFASRSCDGLRSDRIPKLRRGCAH